MGGQELLEILKLLISSYGADIKPLHMKRAIYYRNRDIVAHLLNLFPHLPQAEPYLLKIAVSTRANLSPGAVAHNQPTNQPTHPTRPPIGRGRLRIA